MFNKGSSMSNSGKKEKARIIQANRGELNRYGLLPYHRTKDFRKKISVLYYGILPKYTEDQNGRWPVFKLGKNTYVKPDTASASSVHRPQM